LAMSSRNVYLDAAERALAPQLYAVLSEMRGDLASGRAAVDTLRLGMSRLEKSGFRIDYLELRDSETLLPLEATVETPARLLAAAYLGPVRLIDNVAVVPVARS
jgi:pantoate--beta-alanine ligase